MPEINVLSKEISELIAAGEVIERPSSVIKELVENSIDSGASHITVEIKNGGTTYMRVTDDGCGISCDDVPKAFLRHATSKVVSKEDLNKICTLGFRGEALASISAVARVELLTKQKEDTYGTLYRIEGSEEVSCERSGCPDGTTIIIRELFYNVPARRKFMKKDVTEANSISQILQKIALSHPETSFKLIRDNRVEFNSSGDGELYSAIYSVYGRDFARDLIPVDHCFNDIRISGYAVKPLYARNNRSFQNFFVNGRYVKSRICSAALESAFHNMIMTGKFPACVLMIDMPPADMDVNIHPAKAEVRFVNEKNVSDAIFFAIKNALVENGLLYEFELKTKTDWTAGASEPAEEPVQQELMFTPVDKIEETEKNLNMTAPEAEKAESQPQSQTSAEKSPVPFFMQVALEQSGEAVKSEEEARNADNYAPEPEQIPADITAPEPADNLCENITAENFRYINSRSFEAPVKEKNVPQPAEPVPENKPAIRVIGEAFKNYIMAEADNSIIMIDKHAAHERIIFERLKSRNCRQYSQMLMTEIRVLLPLNEFDALENNRELLADMGFEFDFSQKPYAAAKAVPTFLMELDMDEIIPEIAENLCLSKQDPQTHIFDDMLHTIACKSAIKANDTNDIRELQALAEQVYADEKIRHCPHGRPVMFTMTKGNIEHQFRRT
ncbi:MAG: DNA mismatch repair endonuclease MutL [Ruminococcus sp.]|nr:DNA mismatch repair endonuclease MutL [Ruminococcus sp.]